MEYWFGVDADFGNQSSSNTFSVTAEMNIGHAADTAQENWSCNIFDVIVVTAGYGKNAAGEGLNKWWWNSTYWIGDCNVDQKIDIFDSTWITGQYGKW